MAARAAARARQDPAADRGNPAAERQRARHDRRRRLRQSGARDGERRHDRGGADGVLRRLRHRNEGHVDPDGAGRGQLLGARTLGSCRPHHPVQSSVYVLRRKIRRPARRRQYRDREAAGAGAAVLAAAGRIDRRAAAGGRVQRRPRRARGRATARQPPGCRHDRAHRQRADRARGDESRLRHRQTRTCWSSAARTR